MSFEQQWREDQFSKGLWDALKDGNSGRMRELLHPINQAPTGLQTYLEPALSDGEKILRNSYEPQQLGRPRPAALEGSQPVSLGTAEADASEREAQ